MVTLLREALQPSQPHPILSVQSVLFVVLHTIIFNYWHCLLICLSLQTVFIYCCSLSVCHSAWYMLEVKAWNAWTYDSFVSDRSPEQCAAAGNPHPQRDASARVPTLRGILLNRDWPLSTGVYKECQRAVRCKGQRAYIWEARCPRGDHTWLGLGGLR